jgi:hypothetical protein
VVAPVNSPTPNQETNRDKALRGEVVKVTDGRLLEMQAQTIAREGVSDNLLHWHWAAVINELIDRRSRETRAGLTADDVDGSPDQFEVRPSRCGWWGEGKGNCNRPAGHRGEHLFDEPRTRKTTGDRNG